MEMLSIVPIDKMPKEITDCPTDNLLQVYKVCLQMALLCVKEDGIGLSAVQVGIPWRLFIVRYTDKEKPIFRYFLNAEYSAFTDDKVISLEGCLSIKNVQGGLRHFQVERHKNIKVEGYELKADSVLRLEPVVMEPVDIYANVFQHEIDHQNLILISDIGIEYEVWK